MCTIRTFLRVVHAREMSKRACMTRKVGPSQRDSYIDISRFENLTPEMLSRILRDLTLGKTVDWSDLVDRMIDRDDQVLSTYETRLSVISASELLIEMPEHVAPERMAAAKLAHALVTHCFSLIEGLSQVAYESLDAIARGYAVHEIEWMDEDGIMRPKALHWISPRRFSYDPKTWKLCLSDPGGDKPYQDPGEPLDTWPDRFLVHEVRGIPGYPRGGVFRSIAWTFMIKAWAMSFWLQGAETYAWPLKSIRLPRGADADVRAKGLQMLDDITVNHSVVLEGDDAKIELIESTVKDGGTWRDLVARCDLSIATAMLGMTDMIAPTRVGAYAAVEQRKGGTLDARIARDERSLSSSWTHCLVRAIVEHNLHLFDGVMPPLPKARWAIPSAEEVIPAHVLPFATIDEVRASAGLPALPNGQGLALAGPTAQTSQAR